MQITRILLCGFACAVAIGLSAVPLAAQTTRSARVLPPLQTVETSGFDRSQSAALFVGVRHFTHDETLAEVRYAVDDAIDLAFVFALERNVRLVDAGRVVLALSGEPQKAESQQKLDALRTAGATVRGAGETDILALLERQARSVGKKGILIVSIATHGFNADGVHYLLAANSLFEHRDVNNDLPQALAADGYIPSVFILDPRNVSGQAPPYFGRSKEGTQLWYGVILPTHQTIERLELVDRNQNGTKQISVWMSSRNVLYLDFDGNLTGTAAATAPRET
ncbi:MAG: caspase family protein [Acidobacteria bacterium]|nr:caspase family protein [Acidobacteriota bacterium]